MGTYINMTFIIKIDDGNHRLSFAYIVFLKSYKKAYFTKKKENIKNFKENIYETNMDYTISDWL